MSDFGLSQAQAQYDAMLPDEPTDEPLICNECDSEAVEGLSDGDTCGRAENPYGPTASKLNPYPTCKGTVGFYEEMEPEDW